MNVHDSPIGLFDSGLGGLSIAIELQELLPNEHLLYAADSLFCPYGSRTIDEINSRSLVMATELVERGAKMLVIACNTATAYVLEELRARFAIPIIGLEPALKPAVAASKNRRVGVLATPRTASSDRMQRLIDRYGEETTVHVLPAPGLVELVEEGSTSITAAREVVSHLVDPLIAAQVDTVVLGCTHYPFLRSTIQSIMGEGVTLIDSGAAIARRTRDLLALHGIAAETTIPGSLEILTTGDVDSVSAIARRLLGRCVHVRHLPSPRELQSVPYALAASPANTSSEWTVSTSAGA